MSTVLSSDDGPVRIITMNRPDARNAMSTELLSALLDAIGDAVRAADVRVLVLTGAHDSFSAGADLREPLDHAAAVRRIDLFCQVYEAVGRCPKPTIAAVRGHCVGGGVEVAAACDLRVADPTASFRFPGAALGFPVGAAKLVGLVGLGQAKDLVLTSRTFDCDEAERMGFVQRVAPSGGSVDVAVAVGREIAANHPDAVAYLKRQFDHFSGLGDRIAAENDALHALTEAAGDYAALTMPKPGVGGWSGGGWTGQ
jgi:enoyl-CoA hydratase/carnithine racemase